MGVKKMLNDNDSKSILIVEDESIIALNLKYDLEDLGYTVIDIVDNGDDAIYKAVEFRPDLTIMDINLKGSVNGIQAAKKILALDLAVIYLTANSDDITFNETISTSPASAFIPKPYNLHTLSKNVALAINRQSVESEKVNEARGIAKDKNNSEIDLLEMESSESLIETDDKQLNYQNYMQYDDLQALLAFIKIQRRFKIDDEEIINFTCVSIASISAIQNMMYDSADESQISTHEFLEEFIKILTDNYVKLNINFSAEIKQDFTLNPKKMFQLMFLINDMVNQSIAYSFDEGLENRISFNLEKIGEGCLLTYQDSGCGIGEVISGSDISGVLFEQLLKQIDGTIESSDDNSTISIKFAIG